VTSKRSVVAAALAGAALAVLAASRTWVTAVVPDLPGADVTVSGRQAAPVVVAVALVALAAAVVVATSGRVARVVGAVALVGAGVVVVAASLGVVRDPAGAVRPAVTEATGVTGASAAVDLSAWPWPAVAGGVLMALAGVVAAVAGRAWASPSRRFEVPSSSAPAADDATTWDALSRGEDPT
jgi:uncharacterized membrane protein (TIGR02234 family)